MITAYEVSKNPGAVHQERYKRAIDQLEGAYRVLGS